MAREMRYAFLDDVRVKNNAKYTLTAHHLDDSIETFIFNMLRGTKLTGLSGISEKNNRILRPLLHLQKKDILTHCETEKIRYITDSTNTEETLQRNYIRHSVVPLFENINPSYPRSIDRLMRYFAEIQTHLNAEIL
jgi:tRNA(Ile)-lysidine synthase